VRHPPSTTLSERRDLPDDKVIALTAAGCLKEGEMTSMDELVTAVIHVRQSWVETTGASIIFASANVVLGHGDILGIPVTRWDISDDYFVEFTFYPRALENEPVKSIKVLVPKQAVLLIVEMKRPEGMQTLGYKKETSK
jgi:hypothetical protein